ncbi:hypothetical protein NQP46_20370 [Streptomyces albus]|nr:hypothetical protein NQP46_20370 [Streptomyces albus]
MPPFRHHVVDPLAHHRGADQVEFARHMEHSPPVVLRVGHCERHAVLPPAR